MGRDNHNAGLHIMKDNQFNTDIQEIDHIGNMIGEHLLEKGITPNNKRKKPGKKLYAKVKHPEIWKNKKK